VVPQEPVAVVRLPASRGFRGSTEERDENMTFGELTEMAPSEVRATIRVGTKMTNEETGIRHVVVGFDRDNRAILAREGSSKPDLIMSFDPIRFHKWDEAEIARSQALLGPDEIARLDEENARFRR
jgi:hypothetical protein